ncbi:prenyltransferase/squalene oxidase repeat-containing protein [Streptomyces sp. NPDC057623]|uniref:prenyltransferase/squalene oxidase repeat-containing protein n=1 Tax=Streptomyces sp. NPDC057623 TaxID=3346187 RepID=UPI0036CA4A16
MTTTSQSEVSPAVIARCRTIQRQLIAHHVGLLDEAGSIRDQCGSRILESALLLALLRKDRTRPDLQERLLSYLRAARAATLLDAHARATMLGEPTDHQQLETYLRRFQHFTGHRKHLLLSTLLTLLGALPSNAHQHTDPAQFRYGGQARWTDLLLCAMKILHTSAHDGIPDDTDLTYLTDQLRNHGHGQPGVWEGHLLVHLIALHALHPHRPHSDLIGDGITNLAGTLNPDGGIPFCTAQEVWGTAVAGAAIADATHGKHPALDRMAVFITQTQQSDGGWGYTRTTTQTDVDDTSKCIAFLRLTDRGHHQQALHRAESYLEHMADPAGGFPTYIKGHTPEAELTAEAIIALTPSWPHHTPALNHSLDYLLDAQHDDGSFPLSWTLSKSAVILHAIDALDTARTAAFPNPSRMNRINDAIAAATAFLENTQNLDGGWGHGPGDPSDLLSTAQALPVIIRHTQQPHLLARAVHYLIDQQHDHGTFTSPPDQVGPRPIPYDFPELANTHTLIAINQLLQHHP